MRGKPKPSKPLQVHIYTYILVRSHTHTHTQKDYIIYPCFLLVNVSRLPKEQYSLFLPNILPVRIFGRYFR